LSGLCCVVVGLFFLSFYWSPLSQLKLFAVQAIHIIAFVHKSLSHLCSVVTSAALPTGMGNTLGNKGAVSLYLKIGNTKMLVVNAHLAAHQKAEKQRNAEFQKINVQIPQMLEKKDSTTAMTSSGVPEEITTVFDKTPEAIEPNSPVMISGQSISSNNNMNSSNNMGDSDDEADATPATQPDDAIAVKSLPSTSDFRRALSNVTQLHQTADVVVFMGDLNYRINGNRYIAFICLCLQEILFNLVA
jgi:hypothetical protein